MLPRIHIGSTIPVPDGFHPEAQGWTRVGEPGLDGFMLRAVALANIVLFASLAAWAPFVSRSDLDGVEDAQMFMILPALPVLMLAHELLHLLAGPRMGMTGTACLGFMPKQFVFYALETAGMTRERWVVVTLTPLAVMTVLPYAVVAATGGHSLAWAGVSIFNAVSSSGDLLSAYCLLMRVPPRAQVRNHGWESWWRRAPHPA